MEIAGPTKTGLFFTNENCKTLIELITMNTERGTRNTKHGTRNLICDMEIAGPTKTGLFLLMKIAKR